MSESQSNTAASMDNRLEMLIAEVESKFIDTEGALSELRHALRELKSYRPEAPTQSGDARPSLGEVQARGPVSDGRAFTSSSEPLSDGASIPPVDEAAAARPSLDEETVGVPFWNGGLKDEPVPEPELSRRDFGMDSTSEGSWPIARPATKKEPEPAVEEPAEIAAPQSEPVSGLAAGIEDEATGRDDVGRIVVEMRDFSDEASESTSIDEPASDAIADLGAEEQRLDVASVVSDLRGSLDLEPKDAVEATEAPEGDDDEARRQEVARMVAEMRAGDAEEPEVETAAGEKSEARTQDNRWMSAPVRAEGLSAAEPEVDAPIEDDDEATRDDVASMVAQMRAEIDVGDATDGGTVSEDPDEEVRDEVRRAVEAARAEMASGYKDSSEEDSSEASPSGDKKFSFPDWQSSRIEPSGPPVIVIKDSEGRVELARVYDTLSRVECDENAALLNYTPHSVTVGLNARASVPEVEALTDAVKAVFGRDCEVDSDGVRVNVQIGKDLKGKHSAA